MKDNKKSQNMQIVMLIIAAMTLVVLFLIFSPAGKTMIAKMSGLRVWS